ncbi:MAG: 3-deoxy-manno-octulosonate cytidylyltransferase [Muribaculaceae bacterium]|nr:3-deoxy-manno-octulosonate cytidylyltransferase [Muribaculaceae bacterium]
MTKFIGIIPARYASSRFPGKPLADICGKTMIERVYRRAETALDEVIVATDDDRIRAEVERFGGKVVMTSPNHKSGTDRVNEAYRLSGSTADVIINIQGDEPFVATSQIEELKRCFKYPETQIATLARKFDKTAGFEALFDPNKVKVIFNNQDKAIYFSRAIIPYVRGTEWRNWLDERDFFIHVGMYAYRAAVLKELTSLPQSSLELAESLEQLRWIENGYSIMVGVTEEPTIGIDTADDLREAIELCKSIEG